MNLSGLLSADPWSWLWWAGAGVLLVVELLSGTFYLLMIALGFAAGGLARLAGLAWSGQLVIAAALAMLAIGGVRAWRRRGKRTAGVSAVPSNSPGRVLRNDGADDGIDDAAQDDPARIGTADAAMNLDIGASVYVMHWEGGRGRARYRGADWNVALAPGVVESVGWYRIRGIDGICLILQI